MRIYIRLTANEERVPFNYQQLLVGTFHKWLGSNNIHDTTSLYSLSWLDHGIVNKHGFDFPNGATFFISAHDTSLVKQLIDAVQQDARLFCGMGAEELVLKPTPTFGEYQRYIVQSPILIKRKQGERIQFYYPENPESDSLMTETLRRKLKLAGLSHNVRVSFDREYPRPVKKLCTYKGIKNKGTLNPVIVEGDPEAVSFAWEVGIGNSTGIGFGAVK
ncbi:MAG: CRISPR-associated endoribonuclease Cas6 [Bacteroidota bacterium]